MTKNSETRTRESWPQRRPEFMRALGLLPPYTTEDVKQAYFARAKTVHPDAGGDVAAFRQLQQDFERAIEYAQCHSDPLRWIASRVDRYLALQEMISDIEGRGGKVELEEVAWLHEAYGDFAHLAQRIVGIQFRGPDFGNETLTLLLSRQMLVPRLRKLDLAFSRITDEGLARLHVFHHLRSLDLQATRISSRGLATLRLPALTWLNLQGTSVRWWGLAVLRWRRSSCAIVTPNGNTVGR